MGIYATKHPGNIIVSPDKDLRQIPGRLYDFNETVEITEEEGSNWHLIQSLSGDSTDGYSGCPGIGIKRAVTLFEEHGYTWQTVVDTFRSKGLTEEDALMNAQLAKILTIEEYDWQSRSIIPWNPTSSNSRADDGAVIQT